MVTCRFKFNLKCYPVVPDFSEHFWHNFNTIKLCILPVLGGLLAINLHASF